jgi:8-oxo-dGTP pyrophosphatase MutT (NUDIX family)
MWLFTTFGFYSVVQKPGDSDLTIRARARADLARLKERYLPELGAIRSEEGTDYPYRASVDHEPFARAAAAIARDIDYSNFKNAVKSEMGADRSDAYARVWSALLQLEKEPEPAPSSPRGPLRRSYGGVVMNSQGQVLLREPANHFDSYVWTFAKGSGAAGESPEQTALREVEEETGVRAKVVGRLPGEFVGSTTINEYWLMEYEAVIGKPDRETQSIRWAEPKEAEELIKKTTKRLGRERDLAVLRAALALKNGG